MPDSPVTNVSQEKPEELDRVSDYGSDFSAEGESLLDQVHEDGPHSSDTLLKSDVHLSNLDDDETPRTIRLPRASNPYGIAHPERLLQSPTDLALPTTAPAEGGNKHLANTNIESRESRTARESSASIEEPLTTNPEIPDPRSPLERFRTKPKKSLSVTDLISPSWCELQYWYTLTKHGKKKRTPAMRQGTSLHKSLEEQVHVAVPVEIRKKEDSWGLRLWNVIQGLRTLRDTGMTRELEIWGTLDGLVVNGVIDELSYSCPDRELEASDRRPQEVASGGQATITDFLSPQGTLEANGADVLTRIRARANKSMEKIYVTDVKTRSAKNLPRRSAFRPTLFQLMSYRRLLCDLATDKVDAREIFDRYDLDPETTFSDDFVAQVGSLNEGIHQASQESSNDPESAFSTQDSLTQLLGHNSLLALWTLMIEEFGATFPHGAQSVGSVLKAEYRDPNNGEVIGAKTLLYDETMLKEYLANQLQWWRGERSPQGVHIDEAYKCGYCEFSEGCSWRQNKIEDAVLKMRERNSSRV